MVVNNWYIIMVGIVREGGRRGGREEGREVGGEEGKREEGKSRRGEILIYRESWRCEGRRE